MQNMRIYYTKDKKLTGNRNNDIVYFHLKTNHYRRHLSNLIFWFLYAGYEVQLKFGFKIVGSMHAFSKEIFKYKSFTLIKRKPAKTELNFYGIGVEKKEDSVFLDPDYFQKDGAWHVPLGMHPMMYFNGWFKKTHELRKNENRPINIFFSGNLNERLYAKDIIRINFNKLSRLEIFRLLKKAFSDDQIVIPLSLNDIYNYDVIKDKIVFNDREKIMIPPEKYLELLSKSKFSLFTPGVVHPLCHNNYEAMSVGAIPVLEHPELFDPPLTHGKNCITFSGPDELIEQIKYVMSMDEYRIKEMRKEALNYYDKYLSAQGIIENIIANKHRGKIHLGLD